MRDMTLVMRELRGDHTMSTTPSSSLSALRNRVLSTLDGLSWLPLLLGRLSVGLLFMSTGWGKVHNIPKVTAFFEKLGIPAPGFHAVLVGYSELLCGAALVVGLFTRLATIPLVASMTVALLTAKRDEIHGVFDLVGQDEFTYWVVLVMIAVLGPGKAALDRLVAARVFGDDGAR
jgi:putative oxidoreductase